MSSNTSSQDMETPFYNWEDPTSLLATILMLLNGIFGVTCNFLIFYIFVKESKERTAFNTICVARAIVNSYVLLTNHIGLFIPMTLTGWNIYGNTIQTWVICVANSLYLANEYLTVLIAVNRFISLFFPLYYAKVCGMKPTLVILLVMYGYRIGMVIFETIEYSSRGCSVLYYTLFLSWTPDFSPECESNSGILLFTAANFTLVLIFNIATFSKIFRFYRNQNNEDREARKRIKKNAYLFVQTVLQDSLYLIDISCTFYFFSLYDSRIWTFLCGTFVWESLHTLDGFIMIMFNERLSFLKKQLYDPLTTKISIVRPSQAPSAAVSIS